MRCVDITGAAHHNQAMNETQDPSPPKVKAEPRKPHNTVRLTDLAQKRAQNLRDNLAKRKQQVRARTQEDNSTDR